MHKDIFFINFPQRATGPEKLSAFEGLGTLSLKKPTWGLPCQIFMVTFTLAALPQASWDDSGLSLGGVFILAGQGILYQTRKGCWIPHCPLSFCLCLSWTKLLTWFSGSWDWLEHHWEPSIHSQGKKMEEREEEMDGCSQSLPAQKHSWLLQLTSWGSPWLKRNKIQRAQEAEMKKDAFPMMGLQGSRVWSEVRWKSIHDKCSASSNRVSTTARHGKQGACEDPRDVLWSFNGTRDFYFFIW